MELETIRSCSGQDEESRYEVQDQDEHHEPTEDKEEIEELIPNTTIVTHCILKNDLERLIRCFDDDCDPYNDEIMELINERDETLGSPLEIAAKLGRVGLTKELIERGADLNDVTPTGYSCLHFAAAWGRLEVVKIHIENGCNINQINIYGERPRDTAQRYSQTDCVNFLDLAEAKGLLQDQIKTILDTITNADKSRRIALRISNEERNTVLSTCKEKQIWLDSTLDAECDDFKTQLESLDEVCQPILVKLKNSRPSECCFNSESCKTVVTGFKTAGHVAMVVSLDDSRKQTVEAMSQKHGRKSKSKSVFTAARIAVKKEHKDKSVMDLQL